MHKLKNKHTGELITTPYMAEVEEYLNSGYYEMIDKPVYTKEIHKRGEFPPVGSLAKYDGDDVEILIDKPDAGGFIVVIVYGEYLFAKPADLEPMPTAEDDLIQFLDGYIDTNESAQLYASKFLEKYNITPKDS